MTVVGRSLVSIGESSCPQYSLLGFAVRTSRGPQPAPPRDSHWQLLPPSHVARRMAAGHLPRLVDSWSWWPMYPFPCGSKAAEPCEQIVRHDRLPARRTGTQRRCRNQRFRERQTLGKVWIRAHFCPLQCPCAPSANSQPNTSRAVVLHDKF